MQLISTNGPIYASTSILLHQPDIAELNQIAVVLQVYAARLIHIVIQGWVI